MMTPLSSSCTQTSAANEQLIAQHSHHPLSGRPLLDSGSLLQGQKTIHILHNGSLYKLQATKLGKLILTK